ncbi:MAG: glycine zipper 2TM domain-containing protein [Massilia sp.]
MNTPLPPVHKGPAFHPMMIIAALAVILFCLAGTAAIMGWIPSSIGGNNKTNGELSEADRNILASRLQADTPAPMPVQQLAAAPQSQYVPAQAPQPSLAQGGLAPVQNYGPPEQAAPVARVTPVRNAPVQLAENRPAKNWCNNCGNIQSIRKITTRAQGSGVGAAGGAVLGGLLGNQIGSGHGRQLATVAGAVGGAVVGNQVEGNMKATTSYEIRVRLDDGHIRTFHQQSVPGWHDGDRVKVVNGHLRSVN